MVVARPATANDVVEIVRYANAQDLSVCTQGAAHSQAEQNVGEGCILVDTKRLSGIGDITPDGTILAGSGATWRAVTEKTFPQRLSPPVMTNNLDVTVGGTLSIAGVGVSSFRHGTQADQVVELEVVTGAGDLEVCSSERNPELFDAVRSGLGQFGIVVSAHLKLRRHGPNVRSYHLLYDDIDRLLDDQNTLMKNANVHSLQSLCAPCPQGFKPTSATDWESFAAWFYPLQIGLEFDDVARDDEALLQTLAPYRRIHVQTISFQQFATRMDPVFALWKRMGYWDATHPWIEAILPRSSAGMIQNVLAQLPPTALGGGHVLLWGAQRAASAVPNFVTPQAEQLIGFGILPGIPHDLLAQGLPRLDMLDRLLIAAGGKRYLSGYVRMDAVQWAAHFGERWPQFVAAKRTFDPNGILNPGFVHYGDA